MAAIEANGMITFPMGGEPPEGFRMVNPNPRKRKKDQSEANDQAPEPVAITTEETHEEAPAAEPPKRMTMHLSPPTPRDIAMTDILTDIDLRKRHQAHLDEGKPGDFLTIVLHERGLLEGEDLEKYDRNIIRISPTAPTLQEDVFVQGVSDVPLSADVEVLISKPILDPTPARAADLAVEQFIVRSTPTVDSGELFRQLREPNGATTPPRQSLRERLARAIPRLRPSETS